MRCAIYFVPPPGHPLSISAAAWLGRDVYSGAAVAAHAPGPTEAAHAALTAAPRRYGFHATIKAPFRLADGYDADLLGNRLGAFLAGTSPMSMELSIERLDAFYAFTPTRTIEPLLALAARIVTEFDQFRAPLDDADLARRDVSRLSQEQLAHLTAWGYPYVLEQFQVHMTLTGPVEAGQRPQVEEALAAHFGTRPHPVDISQLVVAVEPSDGAPFVVHSVHPFAVANTRPRA
ncbi:MAG: DUF1045 domain-containing protein [Devosia sp.]